MIETIIAGAIGGLVASLIKSYAFKCYIEKASLANKPTEAFGKMYFMMTQDQIQKAVKAVYLLEKKTVRTYSPDECLFDKIHFCDIPSWLNKDNCECRLK